MQKQFNIINDEIFADMDIRIKIKEISTENINYFVN